MTARDWAHIVAAWLILAVAVGKTLKHGEPWMLTLGLTLAALLLARFWAPLLAVALVLSVALVLATTLALLDVRRKARAEGTRPRQSLKRRRQ